MCYYQPSYGLHESKIIKQYIKALEDSGLITDYTRSWGSLLLLAAKSHQYDCTDICNFIWRLCASYQSLNSITNGFEFLISDAMIVSRTFGILAAIYSLSLLMLTVVTTRFVLENVAKKRLHSEW